MKAIQDYSVIDRKIERRVEKLLIDDGQPINNKKLKVITNFIKKVKQLCEENEIDFSIYCKNSKLFTNFSQTQERYARYKLLDTFAPSTNDYIIPAKNYKKMMIILGKSDKEAMEILSDLFDENFITYENDLIEIRTILGLPIYIEDECDSSDDESHGCQYDENYLYEDLDEEDLNNLREPEEISNTIYCLTDTNKRFWLAYDACEKSLTGFWVIIKKDLLIDTEEPPKTLQFSVLPEEFIQTAEQHKNKIGKIFASKYFYRNYIKHK